MRFARSGAGSASGSADAGGVAKTVVSRVMRRMSHLRRCGSSVSDTADSGGVKRAKADKTSVYVNAISLCKSARAARGYSERSVEADELALGTVVVFAFELDGDVYDAVSGTTPDIDEPTDILGVVVTVVVDVVEDIAAKSKE